MDNSSISTSANNPVRNNINESDLKLPSIKMFSSEEINSKPILSSDFGRIGEKDHFALNPYQHTLDFNNRGNMNTKMVARKPMMTAREKQQQKAALNKKNSQEKRQESKSAKTLPAIFFIIFLN